MNLRTLTKGQQIQEKFAVLSMEERYTTNGRPFLAAELSCATGTINAKVWEDSLSTCPLEVGKVFLVHAVVDSYRDVTSLTLSQAYTTDDSLDKYLNPKPTLVFDIETVGERFEELEPWDQDYFLNTLQKYESDKEIAKQRTALYPLYGFVATIGMFNPHTEKGMVYILGKGEYAAENPNFNYQTFATEAELLEAFWKTSQKYKRFVTFNGHRFDFPYLVIRSAIRRVKVPLEINYRQDSFVDLMAKFQGERGYKLEAICRALGVTNPKEKGVSGLHVSHLFEEGKVQEIADYVARDAISTSELYKIWCQYMAGKIII